MRISIEEKHSLVARYQAGESVSDICADSGVPRVRSTHGSSRTL